VGAIPRNLRAMGFLAKEAVHGPWARPAGQGHSKSAPQRNTLDSELGK